MSVGRAYRVLGAAVSGCVIGTLQAVLLVGLLANQKSKIGQSEPDTFDIFPAVYWLVGFLVVTGVLIPVVLRVLGNRWCRGGGVAVITIECALGLWIGGELWPSKSDWRALVLSPVLAVLLASGYLLLPKHHESPK